LDEVLNGIYTIVVSNKLALVSTMTLMLLASFFSVVISFFFFDKMFFYYKSLFLIELLNIHVPRAYAKEA
jgi:hypothetical protein